VPARPDDGYVSLEVLEVQRSADVRWPHYRGAGGFMAAWPAPSCSRSCRTRCVQRAAILEFWMGLFLVVLALVAANAESRGGGGMRGLLARVCADDRALRNQGRQALWRYRRHNMRHFARAARAALIGQMAPARHFVNLLAACWRFRRTSPAGGQISRGSGRGAGAPALVGLPDNQLFGDLTPLETIRSPSTSGWVSRDWRPQWDGRS